MFCKKCGKELEEGTLFCPFCGQKQTEELKNAEKAEEQISNKKLMLTGAVMAVVILAVIAVFKLIGKEPEKHAAVNVAVEESAEIENVSKEPQKEKTEEESVDSADSETIQTTTEGEGKETESEETEVKAEKKSQVSHMTIGENEYFGENEYWFDEDGALTKASGDWDIDIQYLTDSEGNKVKGNMAERLIDMTSVDEIWNEGFLPCCNTKGHLIESNSIIVNGGGTQSTTYTHDGENIAEAQTVYQDDTMYRRVTDISFQYEEDHDQIVLSMHEVSSDFEGEFWDMFTCSFDGDKLVECIYDADSSRGYDADSSRIRVYDGSGNLVREKHDFKMSDDYTDETTYQYDSRGNLIKCERLNLTEENGVEKENSVDTDVYQYDENGYITQQESEAHKTREGNPYEDFQAVIDFQYDDNGNMVQEKLKNETLRYDEAGTVVEQSVYDRNYIWEYDTEGKLTYYSYLSSSTGGEVVEAASTYLYDEQGRLTEVLVDGETAMTIGYTDAGMLEQIDVVKEIENGNSVEWKLINSLLPAEEIAEIQLFSFDGYSIMNRNMMIEYR